VSVDLLELGGRLAVATVTAAQVIGPIQWGHSGPLCHALSLSSWTLMRRRRATVPVATPRPMMNRRAAARSDEWAQHFSNASCSHRSRGRDIMCPVRWGTSLKTVDAGGRNTSLDLMVSVPRGLKLTDYSFTASLIIPTIDWQMPQRAVCSIGKSF